MLRVLRAELLKLRRARTVMWTVVVVAFFASMSAWGAETWAPDAPVTWVGTLASGTVWLAGWWGVLIFGLATAHLFGGEFSDGTAPAMLTAPITRSRFIVAKLAVLALWVLALTLVSVVAHIVIAALQGADGFTWRYVGENVCDSLLVALLLYLTLPVVALVAMIGRGLIAPMIFSTAMTVAGWTFGFLGWSRWNGRAFAEVASRNVLRGLRSYLGSVREAADGTVLAAESRNRRAGLNMRPPCRNPVMTGTGMPPGARNMAAPRFHRGLAMPPGAVNRFSCTF